jgi:hypothetical protein
MARMRTAASFPWGATSISPWQRTILKVYKILETLEIKVLEIKGKAFKVKGLTFKGLTIKVRKHGGPTEAWEGISGDARPEGRRTYLRRPRARLKPGMRLAMGLRVRERLAVSPLRCAMGLR